MTKDQISSVPPNNCELETVGSHRQTIYLVMTMMMRPKLSSISYCTMSVIVLVRMDRKSNIGRAVGRQTGLKLSTKFPGFGEGRFKKRGAKSQRPQKV